MTNLFWLALSVAVWTGLILYGSWDYRAKFNRVQRVAWILTWGVFGVSALILHLFFVAAVGAF